MSTLSIWSTSSRGSFMRIISGRLCRSMALGDWTRCLGFLALEGLFGKGARYHEAFRTRLYELNS
jgi:hypothetical protein